MDSITSKRDFYVKSIGNHPEQLVDRCDRLTFIGLYEAFGKRTTSFYKYEYSYIDGERKEFTGQWNRDVELCYEVGDSRSSISLEGVLGAVHGMVTRKDRAALKRLRKFALANAYVMGDGPTEYTLMPQLAAVIEKSIKLMDEDTSVESQLKGYRGNVIADYILLHGRVYGYLNTWHVKMLEKLTIVSPDNPIYHAILARFTGDEVHKNIAINILLREDLFSSDFLPTERVNEFSWGDAPPAILYIYTVGILEGK
jgi:hypothetical protein